MHDSVKSATGIEAEAEGHAGLMQAGLNQGAEQRLAGTPMIDDYIKTPEQVGNGDGCSNGDTNCKSNSTSNSDARSLRCPAGHGLSNAILWAAAGRPRPLHVRASPHSPQASLCQAPVGPGGCHVPYLAFALHAQMLPCAVLQREVER